MFQHEPAPKPESTNRAIRMLPFALAAGLGAYYLLTKLGLGDDWTPLLSAIVGGWVLGRLTRRAD
jgi:uncharacterized membrane protein YjjB (DUF3815 family)